MKWRCIVCGYIHEGPAPPAICPICGSPAEKFVLIEDEKPASAELKVANLMNLFQTQEGPVKKIVLAATEELSVDVYYFAPGQVLAYHKHPTGDQVFTIIQGEGRFHLDPGTEVTREVQAGDVILVPKDTWHQLVNRGADSLIAIQSTRQPAGYTIRT